MKPSDSIWLHASGLSKEKHDGLLFVLDSLRYDDNICGQNKRTQTKDPVKLWQRLFNKI